MPACQFLYKHEDFTVIQFIFHNAEGLATHCEDLLENPCFTKSDVILLAKMHTIPIDDFKISGSD